ncbi:MAG: LacI family DNA-binding transcriptional regulator [Christensenellales bacterium]
MSNKTKATIHDIAKLAGVSSATVSHVINNTRFVSDALKLKVNEAVKTLDYIPDTSAKNLRTGKTNLIGVIVPDISNYFFSAIIEIADELVSKEGYHLIVCHTNADQDLEKYYLKKMSAGLVEGILLASTLDSYHEIDAILPANFPITLIDRIPKKTTVDSVTTSTYKNVYDITCELVKRGHARIGFIAGLQHLSTTYERLRGYVDAMNSCGKEVEKNFVQYYDFNTKDVRSCIDRLLQEKCSVIICSSGNISLRSLIVLESEKRLRINKDIDVVIFDDFSLFDYINTDIIKQPITKIGEMVCELLLNRIKNQNVPVRKIVLDTQLILKKQ